MKWLSLVMMAAALPACGVVGAPVAPEMIGVAPVIERQRQAQEPAGSQPAEEPSGTEPDQLDPLPQGQDEELLPLRPVGTR